MLQVKRSQVVLLVQGDVVSAHSLELLELLGKLVLDAPLIARLLLEHLFELSYSLIVGAKGSLLEGTLFTNTTPPGEQDGKIPRFVQHQLHSIEEIISSWLKFANLNPREVNVKVLLQVAIVHHLAVFIELA